MPFKFPSAGRHGGRNLYQLSASGRSLGSLLYNQLRAEGVEPWYETLVGAGQDWRLATARALEAVAKQCRRSDRAGGSCGTRNVRFAPKADIRQ